ncbi:porin [Herbaspirillum sp. alder98]|uniref:porin n=1 Tax=Herbaspirillum sp. alder98 TaxID=2913096 RepID=UPI001CD82DA1|nr:porin [Herbaspirillum sp. alder98]MCA1325091.1 porin [Herbaspirillum sp. alder98]
MKQALRIKETCVAIAAIAACSAVQAQTNVTIYGILDMGIVHESGGAAGSVNKVTSGIGSGSRLGFKGTEDLGGGMSALFLLESGFQMDTGAMGQGGLLFGRQSYVGLSGTAGTLTFGRQYTPQYIGFVLADPYAAGFAGNAANLAANSGSRMDNSVKYVSPAYRGFTGEAVVGFGENAGANAMGRAWGGALAYAGGNFNARLAHHNRNMDTTAVQRTENAKNTLLSASYDLKVVKFSVGYGINRGYGSSALNNANAYGLATAPTPSTNSRDIILGATVPLGRHKLITSFIYKDDRTSFNQDARQFSLGYLYALSARTELYTTAARMWNRNGAGYTVGSAIETGSGDFAWNAGIRHSF